MARQDKTRLKIRADIQEKKDRDASSPPRKQDIKTKQNKRHKRTSREPHSKAWIKIWDNFHVRAS